MLPSSFDINAMLQAISNHCPDLTELAIGYDRFEPETLAMLRPLLLRLQKITIPSTDILDQYGDVAWQFDELDIMIFMNPMMPNIQMPRLKKLAFRAAEFKYGKNDKMIYEFLARHADVTELQFRKMKLSWTQLCTLADCLPKLQQLTIEEFKIIDSDRSQPPRVFECLTACEIGHCRRVAYCLLLQLLRGAPLKRLKLYDSDSTGNGDSPMYPIESICRLTTISSLCLDMSRSRYISFRGDHESSSYLGDDGLTQITRSLKGLQELYIAQGIFTFTCIRDALSRSNALTKFNVGIHFDGRPSFKKAVLDDISTIISARPELHVKIRVGRKCFSVSENVPGSAFVCTFRQFGALE